MPLAYLMLCGASVLAPIILFGIAIWTGIERQLALAALERRVRERSLEQRRLAQVIWFSTTGTPPVVPTRRSSRTAA
jgi:hypothetical protein